MNEKEKKFLKELKELLKKYNASISSGCADYSDIYGLYEEGMGIKVNGKLIKTTSGLTLKATDL